jgi:DNA-binding PadR family transcriptional regulator
LAKEPVDSRLPLRPADFQILMVVAKGPMHAYGISKATEDNGPGGVRLEIGSLYRTLNRLRTDGLLRETETTESGPQNQTRRGYAITDLGREVAAAEAARLEAVVAMARDCSFLQETES